MPRRNRCDLVDPNLPQCWHVSNRCARSLALLEPEASSLDHAVVEEAPFHRKELLLARLEALVAVFSIEVLAFSVMGNHMHLILRNVPEVGQGWSAGTVQGGSRGPAVAREIDESDNHNQGVALGAFYRNILRGSRRSFLVVPVPV